MALYIRWPNSGTITGSVAATQIGFGIGALDGQAPSSAGASVSSSSIFMQSATAIFPGLVSSAAQTFTGLKTFVLGPVISSLEINAPVKTNGSKILVSGSISLTTDVTGNLPLIQTSGSISLTSQVSGILPVQNGGTGVGSAFQTGSVVFVDGAGKYTEDNTNFYWDDTNNRLGLGTSTPVGTIQINSGTIVGSGAVQVGTTINCTPGLFIDGTTSSGSTLSQFTSTVFNPPTYSAVNVSPLVSSAETLRVNGAAISGSNSFFTSSYALRVTSANVGSATVTNSYGLSVLGQTGATNNYAAVFAGGFVGIGTGSPASLLHLVGNISAPAWGANGIALRQATATYTDNTSSGPISNIALNNLNGGILASVSSITVTAGSTLFISPITAGANTSLTAAYAIFSNGNNRFSGYNAFGPTNAPTSVIQIGGALTSSTWTTTGIQLASIGATYTDQNGTGTNALKVQNSFAVTTMAAVSSLTVTNAATVYIAGPPVGSVNVTITNQNSLFVAGSSSTFIGNINAGSLSAPSHVIGSVSITQTATGAAYSLGLPTAQGSSSSTALMNDGAGGLSWIIPPGNFYCNAYYPASANNYWTNTNGSTSDFTAVGSIPTPTTFVNSRMGTIAKATGSLPGINIASAPRTGTVRVTCSYSILPGTLLTTSDWTVTLIETVGSSVLGIHSGNITANSANNIQFPATMVGYFSAVSGNAINLKLQSAITGPTTAFIGGNIAPSAGSMLTYSLEYIT